LVLVSTQVVVALVASATALAVSVVNYLTKRRSDKDLERLKDELAGARDEENARRDYEYDARKRLYEELQPLLFQLSELCQGAYYRIRDLAARARAGELEAGEANWLRDEPYYLTTLHRLLAPSVLFRLCQRRLTFVDLTVEPRIRAQYELAKQAYLSWSGFSLAQAGRPLRYKPYEDGPGPEAVHALQHIVLGDLDRLIDSMTVREGDSSLRCVSYGEFEDEYRKPESRVQQAVAKIDDVFTDFHPGRRPVLWRVLVAQAHLHMALVHSLEAGLRGLVDDTLSPANALTPQDYRELDWREPDSSPPESEALDEPLAAVREYLTARFPDASVGPADPAPS
jgi:hypothetical protein